LRRVVFSIIIILFTLAVSAVALWPFFPPSAEKAGFNFATDAYGSLYLSESHADCSFLYRVDGRSNVEHVLKTNGIITRVVGLGDHIYFLTVEDDFSKGWSLMETDRDLDRAREVASGTFDLLGEAYTLSSGEGKVFLSGAGPLGQRLLALSYVPDGKGASADDAANAESGLTDASVASGAGVTGASVVGGDEQAIAYGNAGGQGTIAGIKGMNVYMQYSLTGDDSATDYVCDGESIIVLLTTGHIARVTPDGLNRTEELYKDSLLRCEGGVLTVLNKNDSKVLAESAALKFTSVHEYSDLNVRGFAVKGGEAVLLASVGDKKASLYFADPASLSKWEKVPKMDVPLMERLGFVDYKSPKVFIIVLTLAIAFILSGMIAINVRILVLRVCTTFAAMGCFMLSVMCYLVFKTAGSLALVEVDPGSGGVLSEIIASPNIQANLLSLSSLGGVPREYLASEGMQSDVAFSAFLNGGVALICAVIISVVFMVFSLRPMRDLTKRIGRFVEGDFSVDGMVATKGDLGKLIRAVTEMGVSLAIKQYETNCMVDSYARFVPRNAAGLLGRAGIMEVSTGDIAAIDECIALVSIENRHSVMHRTDRQGFMDFMNGSFTKIMEFALQRKGAMLSAELLDVLPILFSAKLGAKPDDTLRFGLDLIDCVDDVDGEGELPAPDFFLLMHKTDFLYGIAGTDKKAFTFISSAELNFLRACNAPLRQLGIHMVATSQYLDNLEADGSKDVADSFAKRHIGMVRFADEARDYTLYEMLDYLSDRERSLRLSYDERVQNAIDMFYRDDFYPAMVEFSSILKANPSDGLVRWYAFACEKYFREKDPSKVRHQLFGSEDT
jgi:hypothetical protein